MTEHDDDLESTVDQDAQLETDTFPNTAEEFDDEDEPPRGDDSEAPILDDDAAEL
jgi:hypothetical protein